MDNPNRLISHAFEQAMGGFYVIQALRKVAALQQAATGEALARDAETLVEELRDMPDMRAAFSELNPYPLPFGGVEGFKARLVSDHLLLFRVGVDAASLILSHTILDGVADLCCRASVAAEPTTWLFAVREKTFSLRDLEKATPQQLQERALRQYLVSLSRESLLKRVDLLFKVCKPDKSVLMSGNNRFSRDRLERLDALRHTFVHEPSPARRFPFLHHIETWKTAEQDIDFLAWTPMVLIMATKNRHNLETSPFHLV